MRRREFIRLLAATVAAWPRAARAQPPERVRRIALLGSGAAQSSGIFVDALQQGLFENGLIEGRDYALDIRWADGEYGRFPALAAEAVKQNPRWSPATPFASVRSAQAARSMDPIGNAPLHGPVGAGPGASLAPAGGKTPGIANLSEDVTPKVLEILRV